MFTRILVPLDGSEVSEGILPYVSELAKGLDIPLTLLSVVDVDSIEVPKHLPLEERPIEDLPSPTSLGVGAQPEDREIKGTYVSRLFEGAAKEAMARLRERAKWLALERVRAASVTTVGRPAEEIVRIAGREGCDLIAMSTRGRSPLGRSILGSVTDKVLHSSCLPTLTLTPQMAERFHQQDVSLSQITVPLDGSALAETAPPYVEFLARKLSLDVVLLRVAKVGDFYSTYTAYTYAGSVDPDARAEEEAVAYLKGVARKLTAKGVGIQRRLMRGAPSQAIVEYARDVPHAMIAMATHGRSGFTRWVLGSVTEAVVRASGAPVLVIPPQRAEDD